MVSRGSFWVVPHVSHDGAKGWVEGVPGTPPSEVTFTLAAESMTSTNAASSHLSFLFPSRLEMMDIGKEYDCTPRWRSVGVLACEGYAISLAILWVVPYVSHDGAKGWVEGVPRTPPSEVTLTLAAESMTSANAVYLSFWFPVER